MHSGPCGCENILQFCICCSPIGGGVGTCVSGLRSGNHPLVCLKKEVWLFLLQHIFLGMTHSVLSGSLRRQIMCVLARQWVTRWTGCMQWDELTQKHTHTHRKSLGVILVSHGFDFVANGVVTEPVWGPVREKPRPAAMMSVLVKWLLLKKKKVNVLYTHMQSLHVHGNIH